MANTNRRYTFVSIQDIYDTKKEKEGEGSELVLLKEDVELEFDCILDDIKTVLQITDKEGNVMEDRCRICHEQDGILIVKGNNKKIAELVFGKKKGSKDIGFNHKKEEENEN